MPPSCCAALQCFSWLHLLPAIRSLERKARYLFYFCCFVRFFVNDFSTTRGPIHAKFCMRAYSGSECVFSLFGGWRPLAGGKRGKWNFCYYGSQWGISAFWWFLSDISATLARIHTKYYLCRDNVCRHAPSPCGAHRPLGSGGWGVKNSKNWGVVSFVHRTATISIFLIDAKCSPICMAQTCAHSGVEPSRLAKAFLQGWPKSSKKFRIFHHFETLRPYISEAIKNRGI